MEWSCGRARASLRVPPADDRLRHSLLVPFDPTNRVILKEGASLGFLLPFLFLFFLLFFYCFTFVSCLYGRAED